MKFNFFCYLFCFCFFCITESYGQINSPYTRFGIGELTANSTVAENGMGGISASLQSLSGQGVNFANPASYSDIQLFTFDVGTVLDTRTLISNNPTGRFSSAYYAPYYVNIAFPLSVKRHIAMNLGFRPFSTVGYSQTSIGYLSDKDSFATNYSGKGGLNVGFIGLAKQWKNGISIGANIGYLFGNITRTTQVSFLDTITYANSIYTNNFNVQSLFFEGGVQYKIKLKAVPTKSNPAIQSIYNLVLGATTQIGQGASASGSILNGTINYNTGGSPTIVDTIKYSQSRSSIYIPAQYRFGISFNKLLGNEFFSANKLTVATEYDFANWVNFKNFQQQTNQQNFTTNNWMARIGAQYSPDPIFTRNYISRISYRAGFYYGKDYINTNGKGQVVIGGSIGMGLPLRKPNYSNQAATINISLEYGRVGSAFNTVLQDYFRVYLGFNFSDLWFIKRRYY